MLGSKRVACIIPARLNSTRFPRKILTSISGKPLLQRVWESALSCPVFDQVTFAIDAPETAALIESFGGKYYDTSESCASGTDRLIELVLRKQVNADLWVNWQGDEPFICEEMIQDLLQSCLTQPSDIWTLKKKIECSEDYYNPHIAKVVCDAEGFALYFSRSPIPFYRDPIEEDKKEAYKHVGLYAYTPEALRKLSGLTQCKTEVAEQLEQLRFLHHGLKIRVHETRHEVFGIDLPEHLTKAEARLQGL